jgi:hypothetical protein
MESGRGDTGENDAGSKRTALGRSDAQLDRAILESGISAADAKLPEEAKTAKMKTKIRGKKTFLRSSLSYTKFNPS